MSRIFGCVLFVSLLAGQDVSAVESGTTSEV